MMKQAVTHSSKVISDIKHVLKTDTRVSGTFLFNSSRSSGYYMYHQFNIKKFHVLPTQCICAFCVDL